MRLNRIRLAGFKSFVDPTDLKLPSSLVGIVGPNGCGKSNTIDAVRWVMGESSAKHLRGDSMDDVIFTGSSSRKPVSQASIELVFDNSDGSLGGEYAAYSTISIKREVSREGTSRYLLNNARCRRRDIRDIFLGTGLGPRSYAIIEQGMISRLIEAKPEDLRVFLEEAAGISKYKERRRETETRIAHTRDNLDRLDDLREELDKQLERLKRQASTAERYQALKAEERTRRGELLALRRREYESTRDEQARAMAARESELEQVMAELRATEAAIERARQQRESAAAELESAQAEFYRIGGEVSRLEQRIEHTREQRQQQSQELADVERSLEDALSLQVTDETRITELQASLQDDTPAWEQLAQSQHQSAETLAAAERERDAWREQQARFDRRREEAQRTAQVERSRIEQLERALQQAGQRLERLVVERGELDTENLESQVTAAIDDELSAVAEEARLQSLLERSQQQQQQLREQLRQAQAELNGQRSEQQAHIGRLASLEALQQAALEQDSSAADGWLALHELERQPRLAQALTVQPGWEQAVELVLGSQLEAVVVSPEAIEACLADVPAARLTLWGEGPDRPDEALAQGVTLANKVRSGAPLDETLGRVRIAETLGEAMALRADLASGESVITRDGLWLGRHWLRVARADGHDSVLQREKDIASLRQVLATLEQRIEQQEARIGELGEQLHEHESRRDTLQHDVNSSVRTLAEVRSGLMGARQSLEQTHSRLTRLDDEAAQTRAEREQEAESLQVARKRHAEALEQLEALQAESEVLAADEQRLQQAYEAAREQASADRDANQELAVRVEGLKSLLKATQENLARMHDRIAQLRSRRERVAARLQTVEQDPLEALEQSLAGFLETRLSAEQVLTASRQAQSEVEARLREHEQQRHRHDTRQQQMREQLQAERVASQEVLVRLKTLDEQLAEHDYELSVVLDALPAEANVVDWAQQLEALEKKIQRLGAINLAAIDELAEAATRKDYLDSQHTDVTDALETLEKAIQKIDRETRQRFRDTFDAVNVKFTQFFPRLFGGGNAQLEMTGDDLLSTGVTVRAQPPGKRVSNIHLLSGGEKALTAVALVFAFFELNPSPFCMLDEVDAPLDDANVGRFCALVKEMSERVQFIFITHNKVTMELADQLMGVTMNEPGVSRLVAVDVNEAVELAGV